MRPASEGLIEASASETPLIDPWNRPREEVKKRRVFASTGVVALGLLSVCGTLGLVGLGIYKSGDIKDRATQTWTNLFDKEEKKKASTVRPRDEVEHRPDFVEPSTVDAPLPVPHDPQNNAKGAAKETETKQIGHVKVVLLGSNEPSFRTALEEQSRQAKIAGKEILVATTDDSCKPCLGFFKSIADDRMQQALDPVVLVVVNTDVFKDDLKSFHMDSDSKPWFYLLKPDLGIRDGINGGEWGDDVAENIAPVMGPFVRGELKKRKAPFKEHPGGGVFL